MSRTYEYKDAKNLIKYFKEKLKTASLNADKVVTYSEAINDNINSFISTKKLYNLVSKDMQGEKVDLYDNDIQNFIKNIYFYKAFKKYTCEYKSIYNRVINQSEILIKNLSCGRNAFLYFFLSNKIKMKLMMLIKT